MHCSDQAVSRDQRRSAIVFSQGPVVFCNAARHLVLPRIGEAIEERLVQTHFSAPRPARSQG
jgi:hypothetical protein